MLRDSTHLWRVHSDMAEDTAEGSAPSLGLAVPSRELEQAELREFVKGHTLAPTPARLDRAERADARVTPRFPRDRASSDTLETQLVRHCRSKRSAMQRAIALL